MLREQVEFEHAEAALSDADLARWRAELLDPDSWGEILNTYGRTMRVAVALTDLRGNLLGPCHNPQPVWSLAGSGEGSRECAFCLPPGIPHNCAAGAFEAGETAYSHDRAGLTHASIPLLLGNQRLGVLMAGQCFAQYPQPLALQRVARDLGLPEHKLWEAAVHQIPVSQATLRRYVDLLAALGSAFLRQRYAAILNRELLQTSERYRLVIEGSKDRALLTVNGKGCLTSWNPGAERLLGYTEQETEGEDFSKFFIAEDVANGLPQREIARAAEGGSIDEEYWQVRKDGTRFFSETVVARLGEGVAVEYGFLLRDVTEARKAADAALEAQKLESIGVLAGGIAHDFNNLLTGILGNLSLALVGMDPDDALRPMLDIAERSSVKAAALVSQLLAYAGKSARRVTEFDLSQLVSEILPLIELSIPRTVRLETNLPPGLPWMEADASEIQQIVMNLTINGAEAVGEAAGIVRVSTGAASSTVAGEKQPDVYLEVRDSGCGMDEATRKKIFDPFFTTKFTGRGLGLAVVSGIVRRLKGQLKLESAPGEGSTFRISFPGVPARLPAPKVPVKATVAGSGFMLVADDDPMVRNLVCSIVEPLGFSVLTAEDGRGAVELFRRNSDRIRVVLMDLTMPVMGGLEASVLMHEIRPETPIIISTGYGQADLHGPYSSVVEGVLEKPYTVARLREKIAEVLAPRRNAELKATGGAGA